MKVNAYHIDRIITAGYARQLAAFILMKSKFKKSIYYNFSRNTVSKKCGGMSGPNAGRYINFFLEEGWCAQDGNHLVFKGIGKISGMYSGIVTNMNPDNKFTRKAINLIKCKGKDINSILFQLRLTIVKNPYNQFKKSKSRWIEKHYPATLSIFKTANRYVKKYGIANYSERSQYCVSIRTLAKRLCMSPANVINFLKECVSEGRCVISKTPPKVISVRGLTERNKDMFSYPSGIRNYKFFKDGFAIHYYANSYQFN